MCSHAILVLEMSKNDNETASVGVFCVFSLVCCGKAAVFLIWILIMMMISHLSLGILHSFFYIFPEYFYLLNVTLFLF